MSELKLFVWTDFCPDFTSGLAFAIAETEKEAKKMIEEEFKFTIYSWGVLHIHSLSTKKAYCIGGGAG